MRKLIFLIFISSIPSLVKAQEPIQAISITVINPQYQVDNTSLRFDLSVKNNTDSIIYILKPEPKFFDISEARFDVLGLYGLTKYPYQMIIKTNKKCDVIDPHLVYGEDGSQFSLLPFMIKILPNSTEVFENIQIKRGDALFCKKQTVAVQVVYAPQIKIFDKSKIEDVRKQYELVLKETQLLNNMLPDNAREFQSIEPDNFKKLNEFLTSTLPLIKKLNGETFTSNLSAAKEYK